MEKSNIKEYIEDSILEYKRICWYPSSGLDFEKVILYHNSTPYKKPDLYILSDRVKDSFFTVESLFEKLPLFGLNTEQDYPDSRGVVKAKHRFFDLLFIISDNSVVHEVLRLNKKSKHFIFHRHTDNLIYDLPLPQNGVNNYFKYGFIGSTEPVPSELVYAPTDWRESLEIINGPLEFIDAFGGRSDSGNIVRII